MKPYRFLLIAFLFCGIFCSNISAQGAPVMSIFPFYPGDEEIARRGPFEEDKIFLDLKKGQLVVISESETLRLDLSNRAEVRILAGVKDQGEGMWEYQYMVTNNSKSKAPVKVWFLEIPRPKSRDPRVKDDIALPFGTNPAWEAIHYSIGDGRWAVRWSSRNDQPTVTAGESKSDFLLESDRKPGFVMAYFQSSGPEIVPKHLSPKTRERLQVLSDLSYNSRSELTLGPKYTSDNGLRDIAADYSVGMRRLVISGRLNENSPFVQGCLQYLQEQIDNLDLDETGADSSFTAVPGTTLEQSIYQALRIALDL